MSCTVELGDWGFSLAGDLPAIGQTVSLSGEGRAEIGWRAVRFDKAMIQSLGLWIDTLFLPARALLILDATGRLQHCQIAARLEDEAVFDDALLALKTLV